jgi:cytosolic iron-sulfur protein assembly protein CIAO1
LDVTYLVHRSRQVATFKNHSPLSKDNMTHHDDGSACADGDSTVASQDTLSQQQLSTSGVLTCTTVLQPPSCRFHSHDYVDHSSDHDCHQSHHDITYEQRQPAWDCTFSRDGTYLAICYGAPNPCVRIYHHGVVPSPIRTGTGTDPIDRDDYTTTTTTTVLQQQQPPSLAPTTTTARTSWQLEAELVGVQTRTIRSIDFAPLSRPLVLAAASFDGTIAIWEQRSSQTTRRDPTNHPDTTTTNKNNHHWDCTAQLEGHENEVKCVRWNQTGTLLATCGRDKTVWIWECFLPGAVGGGGPVVIGGGTQPVRNQDPGGRNHHHHTTTDLECLAVLNGHEADVKCVQFADSHDQFGDGNEILLSASYDETVRIWAEEDGDWYCAVCIPSVHTSTIWTLTVAPSATRFLSGSADGSLAIYKCYTTPSESNGRGREGARHPKTTTTTTTNKATWECVGRLPDAHALAIYSVDYAPARASHGRIVSGGADNRIQVYREVLSSTPQQPLFVLDAVATVPTGGDINCVKWHPYDGSVLVSTSDDGTVRIWDYKM